MSVAFADTYYFLALLNPRDDGHEVALQYSELADFRLLTTDYVLLEVADAFCGPADRPRFLALYDILQTSADADIVNVTSELLRRGVDLYRRRPDKSWSLTDCVSFVVMAENGIHDALTADHHFSQAGFRALLVTGAHS